MNELDAIINLKNSIGITNKQLSELSGVPYGTLIKIMSGQTKNPGITRLEAVKRALMEFAKCEEGYLTLPFAKDDVRKTIVDYYSLPSDVRTELIDGKFYNMSSPSLYHQEIVGNLYFKLRSYIEGNHGSCKPFLSPIDVQLNRDEYTMVQPDIALVCDSSKLQGEKIFGAPDLVIEVVSKWSMVRDYFQKVDRYMSAGVREYWIIDPKKERAIVYSNMDDTDNTDVFMYTFSDLIPVGIYPDLIIDLKTVARSGINEY